MGEGSQAHGHIGTSGDDQVSGTARSAQDLVVALVYDCNSLLGAGIRTSERCPVRGTCRGSSPSLLHPMPQSR
jgi:hypothetical protein